MKHFITKFYQEHGFRNLCAVCLIVLLSSFSTQAQDWQSIALGANAGAVVQDGDKVTVTAQTNDGNGAMTDASFFAYKELTGDGYIKVHFSNADSLQKLGKALRFGVSMRSDLTPGSARFNNQLVISTSNNHKGAQTSVRAVAGESAVVSRSKWNIANGNPTDVQSGWLKLTRKGDRFTAWYSADDTEYVLVGWRDKIWTNASAEVTMPEKIFVGLDIQGTQDTEVSITFDHVEVGALPAVPAAASVGVKDLTTITASWKAVEGATGYKVYTFMNFKDHPWTPAGEIVTELYGLPIETTATTLDISEVTFANEIYPPSYDDSQWMTGLQLPVRINGYNEPVGIAVSAIVDGKESGLSTISMITMPAIIDTDWKSLTFGGNTGFCN